jgi:hypothetical protein
MNEPKRWRVILPDGSYREETADSWGIAPSGTLVFYLLTPEQREPRPWVPIASMHVAYSPAAWVRVEPSP